MPVRRRWRPNGEPTGNSTTPSAVSDLPTIKTMAAWFHHRSNPDDALHITRAPGDLVASTSSARMVASRSQSETQKVTACRRTGRFRTDLLSRREHLDAIQRHSITRPPGDDLCLYRARRYAGRLARVQRRPLRRGNRNMTSFSFDTSRPTNLKTLLE